MSNPISKYDDVIDSRDIIERLDYLTDCHSELDNEEKAELEYLQAIKDHCDDAGDWEYGLGLIRETYFTEYCMEMLVDIGELPSPLPGYIVIDEDATADNLKADYDEVDVKGVTYLYRCC